jgi:hypothetical protein
MSMHPLDLLEGLLPGHARRIFQRLLASGDGGLPVDELAEDVPPAALAGILGGLTAHRLVTRHRIGGRIVYLANAELVWRAAESLTEACPKRADMDCDPRCSAVMSALAEIFGEDFQADCPLAE